MRSMRRFGRLSTVVGGATSVLALSVVAIAGSASVGATAAKAANVIAPGCPGLGNGVSHVVQLVFDNVHFFRDNPNVPSDLELMPHLLNFIEQNGTMLSNNHTPLIAHTADDILTNYTGLYGDRHGMAISNSYQTYNADGTTDPAVSFAYWTDPIFDTKSPPNPGHDTNPSMVYSATPPATANPAPAPTTITPAPWVPFTRAGCNVGDVSTANMVLENTAVDIPKVFGPASPEAAQLAADGDSFKDAEVADYVGVGVHCAQGAAAAFCTTATGTKFGQTSPSPTATPDVLPTEPGGYNGFQMLMGHRYLAPQLGAGTPNLTHNGFAVTNAAGNLVDLAGNQINGAFLTNHPGFPGFGPINAAQSLAYMADLQESGVPVTQSYIADIHGNNDRSLPACASAPSALGSGDPCYIAQAQAYDAAFATFFQRLAADGITPANTVFVVTADEGDHEAGANVGRALQPTPANCDGATVSGTTVTPDVACTYPAGTFGELATNVTGLLATQKNNTTPFSLESDAAPNFYVTGKPAPTAPVVRQLERDVAGPDRRQPVHRHHPEHRQLPGRPDRGGHPPLRERRPGPHTHLHHVRQARLLRHTGRAQLQLALRVGQQGLRLQPRRLRRRDQHHLAGPGRPRRGPQGRRRSGPEPGPRFLGPEQRPGHGRAERDDGHLGRPHRHPADRPVPERPEGRLHR